MRQTVLGVYDRYADACSAQRALGEAGIAQADIAIYSMSVDAPVERGPRVYAPGGGDMRHHKPVFDQLEQLFARLFNRGEYPPETEDYREFIRRGGTVLSADVSEMQVDLARDVMRRAGATDIEERTNAWRNGSRTEGHRSSPSVQQRQPLSGVPDVGLARTSAGVNADLKSRAASPPDASTGAAKVQQTSGTGLVGDPLMATPLEDDPYDDELRKDYDANYANSGASYDEYRRAYTHGTTLGQDERYRGQDWQLIEPSAREHWESHYPESGWERFKAAVRHGWERVKGL